MLRRDKLQLQKRLLMPGRSSVLVYRVWNHLEKVFQLVPPAPSYPTLPYHPSLSVKEALDTARDTLRCLGRSWSYLELS